MPQPTQEAQDLFQTLCSSAGFGRTLGSALRILELDEIPPEDGRGWRSAEGWKMSFEGTVVEGMCNYGSNLHGAASAWLLDTCTSAALVAMHTPTFWGQPALGGVTLTMEIQCLKPAPLGTRFVVQTEIVKCSNRLSNLRCEIKDRETGKVIAMGSHCKFWPGSQGSSPDVMAKAKL